MAPGSTTVAPQLAGAMEDIAEEEEVDRKSPPKTEKKPKSKDPSLASPKTPNRSGRTRKKTSRRPRKKGITFKKTVGVHTIPNIDTYTQEERDVTWYNPDEYGQMEDECDTTADLMDSKTELRPHLCSRGLEAWTIEGEQRKESNVQLAIDIVWQAQLEQWKASSDFTECWEFIRSRYVAISKPCLKHANKRADSDEKEVQVYLAGVKSVEKNRQRIMGIHKKSSRERKIRRSTSEQSPKSKSRSTRSPPGRNHSYDNSKSPGKGLLKVTLDDDKTTSSRKSNSKQRRTAGDDDVSVDSRMSNNTRKIAYQPKSRSKVPVSPVASLCTDAESVDSASRRMRSHMSVNSDDSTRRRMLRTASLKPL